MEVEYENVKEEAVYEEICEQLTSREDDSKLGGEKKVLTFKFKCNTRTFVLTTVIAVVTAVVIIATSFMVRYWNQPQVDSYFALNDSSGYLTYLSECSHSCGGGIQYFKRICDNTSSKPCDENKTEIQPCNTHPCPEPINGSWSSWTSFSECSDPCGGGARYRTRECNIPSPAYGGLWCDGKDIDIEWCNTISCSKNGSWGEWTVFSECSMTCGGGIKYRVRECDNPSPGLGGKWCDGYNIDTQMCNADRCPVNGSWSKWTSFTQCSVSCGGGLKSRQRKCDNPMPVYGGRPCDGNETEIRLCSTNVCPREGYTAFNDSSGHWTYLSECSKSCGGGIRYLRRVCDNTSSMPCDEIHSEIQKCNTDSCPDSVNGTWSAWTTFSECSDSCGGGARYRTRECNNPSPVYGGLWCDGKDIDIEWCNTIGCPLNGSWGEWTPFSYCSYTCGGGMKYRVRECDNPSPAFGGEWCAGNETDIALCNVGGCPVNGSWSEWTLFTQCSVSCGGGVQSRTRRCNNPSSANGGKQCEGKGKERRLCNAGICPVHGAWESWVPVTECSRYCGGGTQYRIRKCNNPGPAFGGAKCPGNDTNIHQCPVNGGWGNWGSYTSCSHKCGGGSQTRYRSCSNPYPDFGGATCSGSGSETKSCNTYQCPVHGGWSSWSSLTSCSKSCGGGYKYNIRSCTSPRPAYGGSWCYGSNYEYSRCKTHSCPGPTYELSIRKQDMSYHMKEWAVHYAIQALKRHGLSNNAAKEIQDNMQYRFKGYWNCIVKSTSCCYSIRNKSGHYINITIGKVYVTIFRSPD